MKVRALHPVLIPHTPDLQKTEAREATNDAQFREARECREASVSLALVAKGVRGAMFSMGCCVPWEARECREASCGVHIYSIYVFPVSAFFFIDQLYMYPDFILPTVPSLPKE
jgi:hypothetical protein